MWLFQVSQDCSTEVTNKFSTFLKIVSEVLFQRRLVYFLPIIITLQSTQHTIIIQFKFNSRVEESRRVWIKFVKKAWIYFVVGCCTRKRRQMISCR